jgi:hypothetical protein
VLGIPSFGLPVTLRNPSETVVLCHINLQSHVRLFERTPTPNVFKLSGPPIDVPIRELFVTIDVAEHQWSLEDNTLTLTEEQMRKLQDFVARFRVPNEVPLTAEQLGRRISKRRILPDFVVPPVRKVLFFFCLCWGRVRSSCRS